VVDQSPLVASNNRRKERRLKDYINVAGGAGITSKVVVSGGTAEAGSTLPKPLQMEFP